MQIQTTALEVIEAEKKIVRRVAVRGTSDTWLQSNLG